MCLKVPSGPETGRQDQIEKVVLVMFLHPRPSSLSTGLPTTTPSPKITPLRMHFLINAIQNRVTTLTL